MLICHIVTCQNGSFLKDQEPNNLEGTLFYFLINIDIPIISMASSVDTTSTKVEGPSSQIEGDIEKQPVMVVLYGLPGTEKSIDTFLS